jgi:hypothetical protein
MNSDDLEPIGPYVEDELRKAAIRAAIGALSDALNASEGQLRQARRALELVLSAAAPADQRP